MAFNTIVSGARVKATDVEQIVDALSGVAGGGQPISMTTLSDSSNYALDVQNLDGTNSYGLRVRDSASATILLAAKAAVTIGKKVIATGLGTFTAAANMLDIAATWSNASDTFKGILLNITNTNSAAASRLIDLKVGGTTKFAVDTGGLIYGPAWTTFTPTLVQSGTVTGLTVDKAAYAMLGKTAVVQIALTVTDFTGAVGANAITIASIPAAIAPKDNMAAGSGFYNDAGTIYTLSFLSQSSSTFKMYSNTGSDFFGVNPAVTIANGDVLQATLTYEIA